MAVSAVLAHIIVLYSLHYFMCKGVEYAEIEQDSFGNTVDEDSDIGGNEAEGYSIAVENHFDFDINLYYQDSPPFLIGAIEAQNTLHVNTFVGHTFFATEDGPTLKKLATFTVGPEKNVYMLWPNDLEVQQLGEAKVNALKRSHMHPAVQYLDAGRSTSCNARFRSMSSRTIDFYYDGGEPVLSATLRMGQDTSSASYEGHNFFFTPHGDISTVIGRVTVTKDEVLYLLNDPAFPPSQELKAQTDAEMAFIAEYKNRTGILWRSFYGKDGPRPPPTLYMWPADEVGQVHKVVSSHGKWKCRGTVEKCQSREEVPLEIEVISTAPRAFIIKDFLSHYECDAIIEMAQPNLHRSQVGEGSVSAGISDTRSSRNTWITRHRSPESATLTLRAADLLQIDESLLSSNTNAEEMQVVHYEVGQKYDPHHDWGVSGYPESRYITLLLYLTDMKSPKAGGETSFPKAGDGRGIKVHPGKGSAVLFYNLLEDGNSDDLALHEARPVKEGEKWLANYWVWDPSRKD